jgi:hypothetical protein
MASITAQRRLVKSPPELWAQLSDAQELARHLGEFGDIRITRLEAERTVAWEGERARGTVELEPSGWGTRVTVTAETVGSEVAEAEEPPQPGDGGDDDDDDDLSPPALELTVESAALEVPLPDPAPDPDPGPPPDPAPEPGPGPEPSPHRKPGFLARLFGRRRRAEPPSADPSPVDPSPSPDVGPPATVAAQRAISQDPPLPAESAPEPIADAPAPAEDDPPLAEPAPAQSDPRDEKTAAILETVLDDLGAAHHRPFSRG